MEKHFSKGFLIIILCIFSFSGFTQGHWRLGGNNGVPAVDNVFPPGNNFLGTIPPANIPLEIGVFGNQDIFIDNLNGAPQLLPAGSGNPSVLQGGHWVGLGRVFFPSTGTNSNPQLAPQAHLYIHNGSLKPPVIQNFPPLIKKTLPFPV
jgi:hypothetical protein